MDEQVVKQQTVSKEDTEDLTDEEYAQYVKGKVIR